MRQTEIWRKSVIDLKVNSVNVSALFHNFVFTLSFCLCTIQIDFHSIVNLCYLNAYRFVCRALTTVKMTFSIKIAIFQCTINEYSRFFNRFLSSLIFILAFRFMSSFVLPNVQRMYALLANEQTNCKFNWLWAKQWKHYMCKKVEKKLNTIRDCAYAWSFSPPQTNINFSLYFFFVIFDPTYEDLFLFFLYDFTVTFRLNWKTKLTHLLRWFFELFSIALIKRNQTELRLPIFFYFSFDFVLFLVSFVKWKIDFNAIHQEMNKQRQAILMICFSS